MTELASGNFAARVPADRDDEVGRAIRAFNHMAEQLERQRARLVYLTQLASWQSLARKMAHEIEELAHADPPDHGGDAGALRRGRPRPSPSRPPQIVIEEVDSLERRVRAFSEFAAEPPVRPEALDVNALVEERTAFLESRPSRGRLRAASRRRDLPPALRRRGPGERHSHEPSGERRRSRRRAADGCSPAPRWPDGKIAVEVHDSGPGLSEEARQSLFEPTISFKKHGMGLGLSIARKSALLVGGDILLVKGELGGAGFRVLLPRHASKPNPDR